MLLKTVEQVGGTTWMKPVRPWGPPPPIRVVPEIDRPFCLVKNHGTRSKVLNRCTRKICWIQRALGHGHVAGLSDEAGELFVSDRVAIDPEAANSYFMDGTLLNVKLFRTHAKRPARNPYHVRVLGVGQITFVPFVATSRAHSPTNKEYRTDSGSIAARSLTNSSPV